MRAAVARPATSVPSALERLARRFVPGGAIPVLSVRAPLMPVVDAYAALLRAQLGLRASHLWSPPRGKTTASEPTAMASEPTATASEPTATASVGTATAVMVNGTATLSRRCVDAFARVEIIGDPSAPPPAMYGGLAFDVTHASDRPWQDYGPGGFVLPRWCYTRVGDEAWLQVAVAERAIDVADEYERILTAIATPIDPNRNRVLSAVEEPKNDWIRRVEAIRSEIRSGRADKIVTARSTRVIASGPFDPVTVTRRLSDREPSATVFAFGRGNMAFVGATPERLVSIRGTQIESEALAGTMSVRPGSGSLLDSGKDRHEHSHVAHFIEREFRAICHRVEMPPQPVLRRLADVVHLCTPIAGELDRPRHVLDVVRRLYPTPAVAGVARDAAMRFIREHEPVGRGWYAGPVGWFDAAGDGDLCVALRCGLLDGAEAHVYAGAGIVAASDPRSEYAETDLKQRRMLEALGAP